MATLRLERRATLDINGGVEVLKWCHTDRSILVLISNIFSNA